MLTQHEMAGFKRFTVSEAPVSTMEFIRPFAKAAGYGDSDGAIGRYCLEFTRRELVKQRSLIQGRDPGDETAGAQIDVVA